MAKLVLCKNYFNIKCIHSSDQLLVATYGTITYLFRNRVELVKLLIKYFIEVKLLLCTTHLSIYLHNN